jgi:hypothetical protein
MEKHVYRQRGTDPMRTHIFILNPCTCGDPYLIQHKKIRVTAFQLSGENDEDLMTRVEFLYYDNEGKSFPHKKSLAFLKGNIRMN